MEDSVNPFCITSFHIQINLHFSCSSDPLYWDKEDVEKWLLWAKKTFLLNHIDASLFPSDGFGICMLTFSDVLHLTGSRKTARVLCQHLNHLKISNTPNSISLAIHIRLVIDSQFADTSLSTTSKMTKWTAILTLQVTSNRALDTRFEVALCYANSVHKIRHYQI